MLRLHFVLILLVLASAIALVSSQHRSRTLHTQLEREHERMRVLEVEWGQLQLEQSTWAAHARIEKLAREKLAMRPPLPGQIIAIEERP